ncbi:YceI family protein [Novosphingobium aquiterrae]|uniref:YceI family protein n=1 Tax=Novosphingobium aquiterrae TaxID=624388 RepID=A0ABV6PG10_9SPHN
MRALIALPLALLCLGAAEPTYHYHLDPAHSDVAAKVAFFGLASKTAHFPKMTGAITLQPGRLDAIDLDVDLDARALTAGDSVTLGRLRGPKFFDAERYPTVHFEGRRMTMTGQVTARVDGSITARGVTRPAVLDVAFRQPPSRATGREAVQLSARTTIDRRTFGMTAYSFIVGRNVAITIDARMVPAPPGARD